MRVLITGIGGFVGYYLTECCVKQGCEVHGIDRFVGPDKDVSPIEAFGAKVHEGDFRDGDGILSLIYKLQPDWIFHLAAQSYVPLSWKSPHETMETNVIGLTHLFEAIRETGLRPRIHIPGSSEEYGLINASEIPVKEDNPLRPLSPYAVSKAAQDLMAYQYYKSYDFHVIRTRAFNHTGPRRGKHFVISNFARQLALIEAELKEPIIEVGNLEVVRDFTDVRDVVRAYWLALERGEAGEVYNVCSGKGRKLHDILRELIGKVGVDVEIRHDPSRFRVSDSPVIYGSAEKFRKKTKWKPDITFDKTLDDILDYWRDKIKTGVIA